jgi:molybdopterin molybdotransferase
MMDGIAVRFIELEKGRCEFKIEGIAPAGEPVKELKLAEGCFEVMTGAPLPIGTDTVIQYEHLKIENGKAFIIKTSDRAKFDRRRNFHPDSLCSHLPALGGVDDRTISGAGSVECSSCGTL